MLIRSLIERLLKKQAGNETNETNKTLEYALAYLKQGWNVIPIRFKTKEPLIQWREYQTRKVTEEEITRWFSKGRLNIAVVTGRISGLLTLDIDSAKHPEALKFLESKELPDTLKNRTHFGVQYFFRYEDNGFEIPCIVGLNGIPGLDVRGNGGYCLVEPSIHPEGTPYRWEKPKSGELIKEPPDWLIDAIHAHLNKRSNQGDKKYTHVFGGTLITEGTRNDTLTSLAGLLKAKGLTYDEAKHLVLCVNKAQCQPPLPTPEVLKILDSVFSYPTPVIGQTTEFKTITWSELVSGEEPEIRFLIEDLLPEGNLIILGGRPKVGKSLLSLLFAIMVGCGLNFWGKKVTKAPVLFCSTEDGEIRLKKRLWRMLGDPRKFNPDFHFYIGSCVLTNKQTFEALRTRVLELGVKLIILDPLINLFRGRELNSAEDMNEVLRPLQDLAKESGACVLVVHHTRKSPSDDPISLIQGSITITGVADGLLILKPIKGEDIKRVTLETVLKDAETSKSIVLSLDPNSLVWQPVGDYEEFQTKTIGEKIIDFLKEGDATTRQIADGLGEDYETVRKALRRLEDKGEIKGEFTKKGRKSGKVYTLISQENTPHPVPINVPINCPNKKSNDFNELGSKNAFIGTTRNCPNKSDSCPNKITVEGDYPEVPHPQGGIFADKPEDPWQGGNKT